MARSGTLVTPNTADSDAWFLAFASSWGINKVQANCTACLGRFPRTLSARSWKNIVPAYLYHQPPTMCIRAKVDRRRSRLVLLASLLPHLTHMTCMYLISRGVAA